MKLCGSSLARHGFNVANRVLNQEALLLLFSVKREQQPKKIEEGTKNKTLL